MKTLLSLMARNTINGGILLVRGDRNLGVGEEHNSEELFFPCFEVRCANTSKNVGVFSFSFF